MNPLSPATRAVTKVGNADFVDVAEPEPQEPVDWGHTLSCVDGNSNESREMLERLVPDIQKTAELVQEITAASREQDTGAEQINKALQQLEKVIQQNATAAEQMAATTEELTAQSEQLTTALGFFRTGDTRPSAAAPSVTPHASLEKMQQAVSQEFPAPRRSSKNGVMLKLKDSNDGLDDQFERF